MDNSVIKEKIYVELIERSRENKENIKVLNMYFPLRDKVKCNLAYVCFNIKCFQ